MQEVYRCPPRPTKLGQGLVQFRQFASSSRSVARSRGILPQSLSHCSQIGAHSQLSYYHSQGYISPSAAIYHRNLQLGANVFIGDRVTIYQHGNSGQVELGDRVRLLDNTYIQTGEGGSLKIGSDTSIQPRCQFSAFKAPIQIGCGVQIAPNCAFYPYNHGIVPGELIKKQPLQTKGGILVDDDAWLGYGAIILDGVRIGKGAVVGAGSVVTDDVPDGAIAVGVPARVVKLRADLA